jgi:hypothetical protein
VRKGDALPEVAQGERLTVGDLSPRVADLLSQLRAELPDAPRERLFPRQVAWEREQQARQRSAAGEPNPHYRPRSVDDRLRDVCRVEAAHDSGTHAEGCPDATREAPGCASRDRCRPEAPCSGAAPHWWAA